MLRTHAVAMALATVLILAPETSLYAMPAQPVGEEYEANWESLNRRPIPSWYEDAKFGIFIHWGVYSVPSFCDTSTYSEWYQRWLDTGSHGGLVRQFHADNYGADFPYRDFAPMFRAELWDPDEWADVFRRAGAKYMVITSKHHDGFCLWPDATAHRSRAYAWNSMDTGPGRDLLGELFEACRRHDVEPGMYYSFMEWHNPLYEEDLAAYVERQMIPQIRELISRYEPAVFWPDGEWNHPDATWRSTEILSWIYNEAPNRDHIVVNDRWGSGLRGSSGDFYTTEYGNIGGGSDGLAGKRPFEECRGIGHSFAFNRAEGYDIYASRTKCVQTLCQLVSQGGNLLLDIGPTADGRIPLIMVDRLLAMGRWLEVNGEAIYGTRRGVFPTLPWGVSTTRDDTLYLHLFAWPRNDMLLVPGLVTGIVRARALHDHEERNLPVTQTENGPVIDLRGLHPHAHASVIRLELDAPPAIDRRIGGDGEGVLTLAARTARVTGGNLRLETAPGKDRLPVQNLGFWSDTTSTARWEVRLQPGRRYAVHLLHALSGDSRGGVIDVSLGENTLSVRIDQPTGGWQAYRDLAVGTILAPGEGEVDLVLQAASLDGHALLNLREVRLVPIPG